MVVPYFPKYSGIISFLEKKKKIKSIVWSEANYPKEKKKSIRQGSALLSDEEAQEIARLLSPNTDTNETAGITNDRDKEGQDREDLEDNTTDCLSDVLSAPDSSLINSVAHDYR